MFDLVYTMGSTWRTPATDSRMHVPGNCVQTDANQLQPHVCNNDGMSMALRPPSGCQAEESPNSWATTSQDHWRVVPKKDKSASSSKTSKSWPVCTMTGSVVSNALICDNTAPATAQGRLKPFSKDRPSRTTNPLEHCQRTNTLLHSLTVHCDNETSLKTLLAKLLLHVFPTLWSPGNIDTRCHNNPMATKATSAELVFRLDESSMCWIFQID